MKINIETVHHMAKLAKLKFTDIEAESCRGEFEKILTYFENIEEEDFTGISLNTFEDSKSVLRKDEMKVFKNKEELFQNAKGMKEDHMVVPKVIE